MTKHIRWYFNVNRWKPTREEWLHLTSSVAEDEVTRINKFVFKEDSKSSLIGQALIRKFLTAATNIPSNQLELIRTEHGRPEVCREYISQIGHPWPKRCDFNVSHSGDYCVLGGFWSEDEQDNFSVGIDVTKIVKKNTSQELRRFLELMSRREFTKREWELVEQVNCEKQKCINFTRLWCLKESFIKATGLGLKFGLSRISFEPSGDSLNRMYHLNPSWLKNHSIRDTCVMVDGKEAKNWQFLETALDDEHLVALGYNHHDRDFNLELDITTSPFLQLDIESLVEALTPIRAPTNEEDWLKFCSRQSR